MPESGGLKLFILLANSLKLSTVKLTIFPRKGNVPISFYYQLVFDFGFFFSKKQSIALSLSKFERYFVLFFK